MQVIYSDQEVPEKVVKSCFLAGPTPRSTAVKSWRLDALNILKKLNYDGTVYVPEWSSFSSKIDYIEQVEWEYKCLESSNAIVFWVPRELTTMPAFTTNVEFGRYVDKPHTFYGRPDWSVKNNYLDWLYRKMSCNRQQEFAEPWNNLEQMLESVVFYLKCV